MRTYCPYKKMGCTMPDNQQRTSPRYLALAGRLSRDIETGCYPVGSLLPTEREICDVHACSRHTARAALSILVDRGLIARRQGSGSVVMATRPSGRYIQIVESLNELIRYSANARLDVIDRCDTATDPTINSEHGIPEGTSWIRLEGLRRTIDDPRPLCWTVINLMARFRPIIEEIGKRPVPVYTLIEERFGERIMEVVQTVDAVPIAPRIAQLLDCCPGSPALKTTRRYIGQNHQVLMIADSIHPGGRTQFATTLRRKFEVD